MPGKPQIFAHRGARRAAPENTLPAFSAALDMGAAGIELDVHLSADGQLVVIHDFSVDKTTDGHGLVTQMSTAELRRLDAGSHFSPAFAGTRIPTLEEVLDLVGSRCRINIEIKSMDIYARDASEAVAAIIRQRSLYEQVIVSSFNPISLIKLRHLDPAIALGVLYDGEMPAFFRRVWAGPPILPEAQHPHHRLIDAAYMAWAQGIGVQVNTWTVNEPEEARRLAALGVTTLITDAPDVLLAELGM
jgi:glycerophosphoryl diester phosphodiesterase